MKIYKPVVLFAALLCCISWCFSQSKEEKILAIRQVFQNINHDSTLKRLKLDGEDFLDFSPDNGAELTGYYKGDTLCKMIVEIGPSYGMCRYEHYYSYGQLVFIYEKQDVFPADSSGDGLNFNKLVLNFEGRYYFDKGRLIDIKTKGKKRFQEKIDTAYITGLVADSKSYIKSLKTHRKK